MTVPLRPLRIVLAVLLGLCATAAVQAQPAGIGGRWVIVSAVSAPWAGPRPQYGLADARRLVGRTVEFGPHSVSAPEPLGCRHARYAAHQDTADMLFEGELAEPNLAGHPRNPVALARALGMTTPTVTTIETGCSEVVFHRFSATTLVFGLNDHVYTLHPAGFSPQPPPPGPRPAGR